MISPEILKNSAGVGLVGAALIGGFLSVAPALEADDGPIEVDRWTDPVHVSYSGVAPSQGARAQGVGRIVEPKSLSVSTSRPKKPDPRQLAERNRAARRVLGKIDEVYEHPEKYRPPSSVERPAPSISPERMKEIRRRVRQHVRQNPAFSNASSKSDGAGGGKLPVPREFILE